MKHYKVIQSFKGSQTGNSEPQEFIKDETYALTEHLAEVALKWLYVEAVADKEADRRETKVEETKVESAKKKKK